MKSNPTIKTITIFLLIVFSVCSKLSAQVLPTQVIVTPSTITISPAMTSQITVSILPTNADDKSVMYTSSNSDVCSVSSSGTVIGISAGIATIAVTSVANPSIIGTVSITVSNVPVSAVVCSISDTVLEINSPKYYSISGIIIPSNATNRGLVYSSSNPSIATVDAQGSITPVGVGTATISVQSVDNQMMGCGIQIRVRETKLCADHTAPALMNDTVYFTKTIKNVSYGQVEVAFAFMREVGNTYFYETPYDSIRQQAESVYVTLRESDTLGYVKIWKYNTKEQCYSDTAQLVLKERSCLPAPKLITGRYFEFFPDDAIPNIEVAESDVVWYSKNGTEVSRGNYLDLESMLNVNNTLDYQYYAMRESKTCKGNVTNVSIYYKQYEIVGQIISDFWINRKDIKVHVNDDEFVTNCDSNGYFKFRLSKPGTYKLSINSSNKFLPFGDTIKTVIITKSVPSSYQTFKVTPSGYNDIGISAYNTVMVIGRSGTIFVSINNIGQKCTSIPISLHVDREMELDENLPTGYVLNDTTLQFTIDSISANANKMFILSFKMTTDWRATGKTVRYCIKINKPNNDENKYNDSVVCYSIIRNSCDPNDKNVTPAYGDDGYVLFNEPLSYHIRFQNTGTFDAENIVVKDTIDENLDINTVEVIDHSHPMTWQLKGREVTFTFADIHLMDSTTNEAESHGYITYRISPKKNLSEKTLVTNTAHIFFDYNPAVVTNTTESRYVSVFPTKASIEDNVSLTKNDKISISPNPANTYISIDNAVGKNIQILNCLGVEMSKITNHSGNKIAINNLPKGLYIVKISDGKTIWSQTFMKQ